MVMLHYTDKTSWNAIRSQIAWHFRAHKPPGTHPEGCFFTTLPPDTPKLALRLRIPVSKIEYAFYFLDIGDLQQIDGDRGKYIFYSSGDYFVSPDRQIDSGSTENVNYP